MAEEKLYKVEYTGGEVVTLGKAGKFMPGTSAYLREDEARAAAARGDFVVQGLDAAPAKPAQVSSLPAAGASTPAAGASTPAPAKAEDKRPEDKKPEDKKSEDKKPEDKKSEDKKPEDKKSEDKADDKK